jgi:uncharacterized protein YbjQ (UPF0145 family)
MIITTTETVPGRRIVRTLGLVRGTTIRARHIGQDLQATIRNLVGGEMVEYTKLIAESREQAIDRAIAEAEKLGADAIVALRFTTSDVARGAAEILVYGTAVVLAPEG